MAAFNFPNSPSTNDLHTENSVTWKWNGTVWKRINNSYLTASTLDISGISTFRDNVTLVKSSGPLLELTTNTGAADATLRLSEGATGSTSNGGGMFYSGADNKLHITCGTNSTTKRITVLRDDGKVGIGTANPNAKLRVHDGSDNDVILWVSGADVTSEYVSLGVQSGKAIVRGGGAGSTNCALAFEYSNGGAETEGMRIASTGKVGINEASPDSYLHINSGTSNACLTLESTDNHADLYLVDNGGQVAISADGNNLKFQKTGSQTETARIDSSGRLLVGTTAGWGSDVKLHLANSGNTYLTITSGTSNNGVLAFSDDGSERGSIDYDHNGDHMLFKTAASERLRITSGGQVNIGGDLAQTSSKLFVTGGSGSDGNINLLELKHGNTVSSGGAGDGPALLLNGEYQNNPWAFAKICSVNSGSGYGADFQIHVHPASGTQGSAVVKALSIVGDGASGANVTITDGNLKVASGHGIDFSATSDASGKTNELMDDYEEGTWTPILYAWNGVLDQSYDTQTGNYIKIGNQVIANFFIDFSSKGTVSGNYTFIGGLPFNHAGTCAGTMVTWGWAMGSNIGWIAGDISSTATVAWVTYHDNNNNNTGYLPSSFLYDNSQIKGTLIYRAA